MVLQDTWLRAATVRENICMSRPDATDEEMIAAAKASGAEYFLVEQDNAPSFDDPFGEVERSIKYIREVL